MIALALSGGGIAGGAWMVGALHAITTETGWDPSRADIILGTSAGAMVGALVASGMTPEVLAGYDGESPAADEIGLEFKPHWSFPRPVLGSPGLALRSLREPWRYGPAGIVAWLPRGVVSTEPLQAAIRRVVPVGWSSHPGLWIVAIDYDSGERVVFGREGAPRADLAPAVAASCAIPGFYHPVTIGGRRYVDGGVYSPSNLDLLAATDVEVVVCLSPMTSHYKGGLLEPTGPIAAFVRGGADRRLAGEIALLKRAGKRVLVVQTHAEDTRAMGYSYMSGRRRERITDTAFRTTAQALRGTELGRVLASLAALARR